MRGFTLIESLIYLALFAFVMEGAVAGMFAISESADRNATKARLEQEAEFLESAMTYEASHDQTVLFPSADNFIRVSNVSITTIDPHFTHVSFTLSSRSETGAPLTEDFSHDLFLPL